MGRKSTLMRQVGLVAIMAQMVSCLGNRAQYGGKSTLMRQVGLVAIMTQMVSCLGNGAQYGGKVNPDKTSWTGRYRGSNGELSW